MFLFFFYEVYTQIMRYGGGNDILDDDGYDAIGEKERKNPRDIVCAAVCSLNISMMTNARSSHARARSLSH